MRSSFNPIGTKKTKCNYLLACSQLLTQKQLTIAFVESATAGRIAAEFSMLPDAGKFLKGGIVCYNSDLKSSLLGVSKKLITVNTPESEIVTYSITLGLQKLIPANLYIGCTGLTSPGGSETPDKPVGTIFLCGIQGQKIIFIEKLNFQGSPEIIVLQTVNQVAKRVYDYLQTLE